MGWWGCGVLEGDTPLDVIGLMEDVYVKSENIVVDDDQGIDDAAFDKWLKLDTSVAKVIDRIDRDDPVHVQVVGYVVMMVGGPIESFRKELLEAIAGDDWNDADRIREMRNFRRRVNRYKGRRTQSRVPQSGLFDKIAEAINDGKSTPINR